MGRTILRGFNRVDTQQNAIAFQKPQKQKLFSHKRQNKRQSPTDRQISSIVATPVSYGLAWFASLFGLATMMREPLSALLVNFNPWTLLNGIYLI